MPLILISTHQALLKSLQDVHAAQLQTERLRALHLQEQLDLAKAQNQHLQNRLVITTQLVVSQQKTISMAMSDLVILKGAGRIRSEQDKPPDLQELRPDVEITDAPTDIGDRRELIKDAQEQYERTLAALEKEIDTSKVTPEEVEAAIPASREEWEREHAQPTDSHLDPVVRG